MARNRAILTSVGTSGNEFQNQNGRKPLDDSFSLILKCGAVGLSCSLTGIGKSFDVDAVYWATVHGRRAVVDCLDDETLAEMEPTGYMKMEQLKAYEEECPACFPKKVELMSFILKSMSLVFQRPKTK